jgi:hypothetical protein
MRKIVAGWLNIKNYAGAPSVGDVFDCQLMISDGLDLAARHVAGGIEGLAVQNDVKRAALFIDRGIAPNESVGSEKLEQFRQQVMHQIDIVASSDFYRTRLGTFDIRWLNQESSQRQRRAAEEFNTCGSGHLDAEVAGVFEFAIKQRVFVQEIVDVGAQLCILLWARCRKMNVRIFYSLVDAETDRPYCPICEAMEEGAAAFSP